MEDYYIKKFLEILNINSVNKLNEGSIDYFWQKKYKDIQTSKNISNKKKENLLIELNNARDELNKIGIESLETLLNNDQTNYLENIETSKSEENSYKDDEVYTRNNSYDSKDEESKDSKQNSFVFLFLVIISFVVGIPIYQEWENKVSNNSNEENINKRRSNSKKTINYSNGRYEGETINGEINGRGTFYFNNGNKYVGNWLNNNKHGYGTFYWADGDRYEGNWENDERTKGSYYWANGDRYVGEYVNGNENGKGTLYWSNGDRYEGYWLDAKRNGYGIYYWNDGSRYEGYWLDSKRNGYGTYTGSSGYTERQYWRNGTLIE